MSLTENKKTIILILIAFVFSFSMRLIWVYQFNGTEQFKFNNEFMINTNDGYYFAEGARDIISGVHQENDYSAIESAASKLTAFLSKILPFQLETIIFYMPAFFSSLLVFPLILLGRSIGKIEVGFVAALLSSIAWSYYNRTMVGYYDTDLLNIVFPTILLWSLVWAIKTKEDKYLLFAAFDILAYRWWYPQSYALELAFFSLIVIYLIYLFYINRDKGKDTKFYEIDEIAFIFQLLTIMLLSMIQIDIILRIMLVIGYFMLFRQTRWHKHMYVMLLMGVILFLATGGFEPIIYRLKLYIFKDAVSVGTEGLKLNFYTVMQTIREASAIPFETFANRISGHTVIFIFSVIGYIWLIIRYPIMLLGLPMLGLGFLANGLFGLVSPGGLRFTVYAIPILGLGIGFLIVELINLIIKKELNLLKYTLITILTAIILAPNIKHIIDYKVPTVFTKNEVNVLNKLKNIAQREDYVISWWDYGYPIRYYSDVKTLVDGSKHSGSVNFPVSYVLNSNQKLASKMARLDVEYTEKAFKEPFNKTNIEQMTIDYGFDDTNDFLDNLSTDIKLPNKTRDIYLYLPNKMMGIIPTVKLFSNINLMDGKKGKTPFFYVSTSIKESTEQIDLGNGISILKKSGEIKIGNNKVRLNNFAITMYDNKGKLHNKIQQIDKNSQINVIFMKNYNRFLVLDKTMYDSLYIQLFVLENYDKNLYEPIILDPLAKVYKLKI